MEPKRKPATEMEQSGIEVRSTAKVKEHAARMEPKRKPATEMEQSGIEVCSTAKVKERHI